MCVQVVQGGVVGRLTARYSENSLLLLAIGVSSLVGLAQVHTQKHRVSHIGLFLFYFLPSSFMLCLFSDCSVVGENI